MARHRLHGGPSPRDYPGRPEALQAAPVISWGADIDIDPDFNDCGQRVDFVLDGILQGA